MAESPFVIQHLLKDKGESDSTSSRIFSVATWGKSQTAIEYIFATSLSSHENLCAAHRLYEDREINAQIGDEIYDHLAAGF